tara:strand:+ start:109 stop:282 length:174 start_codon:yes stop_codon:yes gene_type:complete
MSLFNIILIITAVWLILKVKRFISGIKIQSGTSPMEQKKKTRKTGMDIQDADYEDVK